MTRGLAIVVVILVAAFDVSRARAWSCGEWGCPTWCDVPTYRIGNVSSALEAEAPGTSVSELQRAMHDWTLVDCTDLASSYLGRISSRAVDGDGVSQLEFVESGWALDANVIATTTRVFEAGCMVEADVLMNGQHYAFVTRPGYQGEVNAYSAALHEAGHFYGLGHSQYTGTTMYFRYGIGLLEIKSDDEQGICYLYPGADPPPDCAATGCPSGQECVNGLCFDAPTPLCTNDNDCISVQLCDTATGHCTNRPPGGTDLGSACMVDGDCATALCLPTAAGTICSQTCSAMDPRSCPTGFYCSGEAVGDCALGVCLPGAAGHGAFGSACDHATDCASLFCGNGACSIPCERGLATACPASYTCHPSDVGACGVCGVPSPLGGRCQTSDECASHICFDAEVDGRGFCSATCGSASGCGSGFRCVSMGEESLCLPSGSLHGAATCAVGVRRGDTRPSSVGLFFATCVTLLLARATKRR